MTPPTRILTGLQGTWRRLIAGGEKFATSGPYAVFSLLRER